MTPLVPTEEAKVDNSLSGSIEKAAAAVIKSDEVTKEEPKVEAPKTQETPSIEEEKTEVSDDDTLSEIESKQAAQLYKGLKDPKSSPAIIKYLAEQAGYDKVETKQEVKEAKSTILQALESSLGEEFSFLSPKLATALDKILSEKLAESQRDIRETLEADKLNKVKNETSAAFNKLGNSFFGKAEIPQDIMSEMSKCMERYPPSPNISIEEYITDIFHTSVGRLKVDVKNFKAVESNKARIEKNRTDAVSRLASERGAVTEGKVIGSGPNKSVSLKDAIEAAEAEVLSKGV